MDRPPPKPRHVVDLKGKARCDTIIGHVVENWCHSHLKGKFEITTDHRLVMEDTPDAVLFLFSALNSKFRFIDELH